MSDDQRTTLTEVLGLVKNMVEEAEAMAQQTPDISRDQIAATLVDRFAPKLLIVFEEQEAKR